MQPLRIAIVTFAWPPRNSIGAHRPWSWAKHWSEAGARVRVLTARKYAYDEPLDLIMPDLPGVEVIETDYISGSSILSAWAASGPLAGLARKIHRRLRGAGGHLRNPRDGWLPALAPHIPELARSVDVVVSTYDPAATHQIAAIMKQANPALIWVADYRDLWSLNHAPSWSESQRAQEAYVERQTVGAFADMVSSVSDELSERQGAYLGKPWVTVTNGFDIDISKVSTACAGSLKGARQPLNIVYTGKIYKGLRDPSPLFEVVAEMIDKGKIGSDDVVIHLYGGQLDGIEDLIRAGRYERFVKTHGHISREAALAAQREADMLLLLESSSPDASGVLTGKIFEYISTGIPILSLGSKRNSAIGAMLSSTRTGICTEDDRLVLRSALDDVRLGRRPVWFAPDVNEISKYSRKTQAQILLSSIKTLFSSRKKYDESK